MMRAIRVALACVAVLLPLAAALSREVGVVASDPDSGGQVPVATTSPTSSVHSALTQGIVFSIAEGAGEGRYLVVGTPIKGLVIDPGLG